MQRSAEVAQPAGQCVPCNAALKRRATLQNRRETGGSFKPRRKRGRLGISAVGAPGSRRISLLRLQSKRHNGSSSWASRLLPAGRARTQRIEDNIQRRSLEEDGSRRGESAEWDYKCWNGCANRLQNSPRPFPVSLSRLSAGRWAPVCDRAIIWGRIDDSTSGVQLVADVDEFYLPRLQTGQKAATSSSRYGLELVQTLPPGSGNSKVRALLLRVAPTPASTASRDCGPGQSIEARPAS